MADGKVKIDVELTKDKFEQQLKQLDDTGNQVFNKTGTFGKKAGAMIAAGAALAAAGIGKLATAGLRFNADMEMYTTNFRVMLGSQEEAVKKVEKLQKMAAKTPFELGDLANATQTLLAFNVASDDTQGILQMLGDISLGNADKLNSLTYAYGKMQAAQKVTLEDLNIMIERGFNPLSIIAEQTGETMQEVYDRVSKGAVSVDEITNAMKIATSEGGQFFNGMEEASKTFNGQLSTLKDNFNELLGNATKPLFDFLTNTALPGAIDLVGVLNDNIELLITTLGGLAGAIATAFTVKKIQTMTTFIGLLTGQIKLATVATTIWSKAMAFLSANKFVLIAAAIVGIATALGVAANQAGGFDKLFDGIADKIVLIADKAGEFISAFVSTITERAPEIISAVGQAVTTGLSTIGDNAPAIFDTVLNALSTGLPKAVQFGVDFVLQIINGISQNLPMLIETGTQILVNLIDSISQNLPMLIELGVSIITGLIDSFSANLPMIINAAVTIITGLITGITQYLPMLVGAAIQLILALINGITQALPTLIAAVPQIIIALINGIVASLPKLIAAAPKIIISLISGIIGALPQLIAAAPQIIAALVKGIIGALSSLLSAGKKMLNSVKNGIKNGISGIVSIGKDIISGLWSGISSKISWLKKKISGGLGKVKDFIAGLFEVGSPSKWMRDFIGKNMMIGWGLGITKNVKQVTNAMKIAGKEVQGQALSFSSRSLGVATANQSGGSVVDNRIINQNFYNKQTSPYEAYKKVVKGFAY